MDNNRGVKSLQNDRKRVIILTEKQKRKLQEINDKKSGEKLKKLEKRVRKLQIITFLKTIPIVVVGAILKSTADTIDNLKSSTKTFEKTKVKNQENTNDREDLVLSNDLVEENEEKRRKNYDLKETGEEYDSSISKPIYDDSNDLDNEKNNIKIEKIKERKIIEYYEDKLKEKRFEIKLLAASIPISIETDPYYDNVDEIYKKINLVLKKLDDLEYKIKVEGIVYDDNYLSYLIDSYIREFDDGKLVPDIRSSELYMDISLKIEQLDDEKDKIKEMILKLPNNLDDRQEIGNDNTLKSTGMDTDYLDIQDSEHEQDDGEDENDEVLEDFEDDFLYDEKSVEYEEFFERQEYISAQEKQQEDRAKSELEYFKIRVEALKRQCENLKMMITKRSLIKPTIRNAKLIAVVVLTSVFNMRGLVKGKKRKNRMKLFRKLEYKKSIENDMNEIRSVSNLINKSYQQIDALISEIKTTFSSYDSIEYQSLLDELEDIKRILNEREYEIESIARKKKEDAKQYRR